MLHSAAGTSRTALLTTSVLFLQCTELHTERLKGDVTSVKLA